MRRSVYLMSILILASVALPARAQLRTGAALSAPAGITNLMRPRIAVAQDGAYAIAYEAEVEITDRLREWQVALQLHDVEGGNVGPLHMLEPEAYCTGADGWSADYVDNADMVFRPDGILLVAMSHSGWFSLLGVDDVRDSETTVAAIGSDGQQIDLNSAGTCTQYKLNFIGADDVERPRITAADDGSFLIIQDGFFEDDQSFGEATWRNSAIRIFDGDANEIAEQLIVHDDPGSAQSANWRPDIVIGGSTILVTWQECPTTGNITDECDVVAQFLQIANGTLELLGGNLRVHSGDAHGTINLWPSAAMNASGRSVVVWTDNRSGIGYEIYAQRFGADGQPIGGNIQVSTGEGEPADRPEVAVFDDDRFAVVWDDSSSAGYHARARFFDSAGHPQTATMPLLSNAARQSHSPDVDAAGNWVGLVWIEVEGDLLYVQPARLEISTIVGAEDPALMPSLKVGGYPNPFFETLDLTYELDREGDVEITLYDILGRVVKSVVDARQPAGFYQVAVDGSDLAPGAYVVRLRLREWTDARILVRGR